VLDRIAEQVGIGAVKYAELSTSRAKDYVFDLDRMVSLRGDTGVYLQYAHARLRSLLAKAGDAPVGVDLTVPPLPVERGLALALCRLAADTLRQGLGLLGLAAPDRL
jgi:arginyl-tRNA synthetase